MAFQVMRPRLEPLLPLPWEGLRPANVGWKKRLAWIAALAIGCAVAFGALIAAAEAVSRTVAALAGHEDLPGPLHDDADRRDGAERAGLH